MRILLILIISAFPLFTPTVFAAPKDLPNYFEVNSNIARGGRPTKSGVEQLNNASVKTVINLENVSSAIKKDKKWVESYGMKFISVPMDWKKAPSDKTIEKLLKLLNGQNNYPIYIHCRHGRDRTGLVIALFRVFSEVWTAEEAYEEMLDLGFRPNLVALDSYFKKTTGYGE